MSLPKPMRISQAQSFSAAMRKPGKMVYTDGTFKVHMGASDTPAVGVLVPKKLMKLSVDRHRLKRRIHALAATDFLMDAMLVVQLVKKTSPECSLTELSVFLQTLPSLKGHGEEVIRENPGLPHESEADKMLDNAPPSAL